MEPSTHTRSAVPATATPVMLMHGWSTTSSDQGRGDDRSAPSSVSPSVSGWRWSGGRSRTSRSRPSSCIRHMMEPSESSAMVDWPTTQSGAWNSHCRSINARARPPAAISSDPIRCGSHQPRWSSTKSRLPSRHQRGWPTELPPPPARRRSPPTTGAEPTSSRRATQSSELSQGMDGWSQATQASHTPVRGEPRRGHEVPPLHQGHHRQRAVHRHRHQAVFGGGGGGGNPLLDRHQPPPRPGQPPVGIAEGRTVGRRLGGEADGGRRPIDLPPIPPLIGLVDVEQHTPDHGGRAPAVFVHPAPHAHRRRRGIDRGEARPGPHHQLATTVVGTALGPVEPVTVGLEPATTDLSRGHHRGRPR